MIHKPMIRAMWPAARSSFLLRTSHVRLSRPEEVRCFAAAAKKSMKSEDYVQAKRDAKERRRALYQIQVERQQRLKTRRKNIPQAGAKRKEFRDYFIRKKVDEEYMNRKARQAGLDWEHQVAVILTRNNVVVPDPEDWEEEYETLRTHLDQFGVDYPEPFANNPEPGTVAISDEELLALLPEGFVPAPRITEADESGDVKTVNRKLKSEIYLYVQQQKEWQFPTVSLREDETLLEAANRALADKVGPEVEYWTISNAPCAVTLQALPEVERKQVYGTKTFFMKINYDEGEVNESSTKLEDYAWLDAEEIVDRVNDAEGDTMFYKYLL